MVVKMVTEAGYYGGKFLKAGMSYDTGAEDGAADLSSMTKDELVVEAERRGVDIEGARTKADIIAVLQAAD
ncbi:hypothetical protein [Rhizobium halophytocola]|uniref:Rho termination factor N-terminal domain-containing protein n=1 Tax=Rhizobium halophytocola TaxID=735519 RepID=A0ABS4E2J0_9HYPH|nr:hypothetical protein [Rhizobium halophytocola]MBP1852124.1 hypothetical protein [Rhizobium halophytocola]